MRYKFLAISLLACFLISCGKDLSQFDALLDPGISVKAPQKMLVYEAVGDPNETVGNAFGALFSTFYKLKKAHEMELSPPRARWPKSLETDKDQWLGIYALPVAASVTEISQPILEEHPGLKLEIWDYGTVAEILHIGSYATEGPTVERLHQFIRDQGYVIAGVHEEEYLKGPGMFSKGNPDKYYTIIRYVVKKAGTEIKSNPVETEVTH